MTTTIESPAAPDAGATLPYGPRLTRMLPAMHRAFLGVNRWFAVPLLRAGLGPLFSNPVTGSLLVLRTRGRRSGLWRDAPLGYVIRDGCVYCCAGFGPGTQWLRNLRADPRVELVLPGGAVAGMAEEVTDPGEWAPTMRALLLSMGPIGRWTTGDVRRMSDEELRAVGAGVPLVRIRVTGLAGGPFDPGGSGWIVVNGAVLLAVAIRLARAARNRRRHRSRQAPPARIGPRPT